MCHGAVTYTTAPSYRCCACVTCIFHLKCSVDDGFPIEGCTRQELTFAVAPTLLIVTCVILCRAPLIGLSRCLAGCAYGEGRENEVVMMVELVAHGVRRRWKVKWYIPTIRGGSDVLVSHRVH
ncbi:hypothetical protein, unlikely [Trypanosoma brucei gambiense DAL972]|uniref:Uncharacterized protein n=1 Tax=Trypanosoma brucei gambiense (strain MHOM/CI/86/DAL972) TaxID=679716 RepID=C9ZJI2_TRYB9|nr:hypothetical protein, unlikely [Trypanosoma brucei gambiense DAL972]CBH09541.1 hypothetical protein, unlikely [Trypanosoma brucei gambiense DAL972]|eukprot:XP_011771846.1 hypothetical protein, unlikely [Trypanosoma brucei gambiense DAL972]